MFYLSWSRTRLRCNTRNRTDSTKVRLIETESGVVHRFESNTRSFLSRCVLHCFAQLLAGRLQSAHHHLAHPFEQLIA